MPWERQTLEEIDTAIRGDITTRLAGAYKLLRRSILKVLARAYAGAVHLLYGNIDYNKDQLFITSADEEYLPQHGAEYGVLQNAATKATGNATATGTDGKIIPAGYELESSTNQTYLTDSAATITGGVATLNLTAKEAGADGNEDGEATLSFVSPIPGVDTNVTLDGNGMDGGSDEEDIEDYRLRILERKRRPPHGGAKFDYETWMKEITGVTRAWAIPLYQGRGTIGCAFVRDDDDDLIPSDTEIETVRDYIISHTDPITGKTVGIPATAQGGLYMIKLEKLAVNMTIELYPNTSAIRTAIDAIVAQVVNLNGGPELALYKSIISEAVSSVSGEERHRITFPNGEDYVTASAGQVHVPGTITYEDYNG